MSKTNINKILNLTNDKIGYANFEREEIMKKAKMKKALYGFMGVCILTIGTASVNALTDNSITKAIDNLSKVKVNGEDYNATCKEKGDGSISCKVGDTGVIYEISEEGKNYDYEIDVKTENNDADLTETVELNIKDKEQ